MITEQELKDRCTPKFIVWIVEPVINLLKFKNSGSTNFGFNDFEWSLFPLLIHRAVEGWNKLKNGIIRIYESTVNLNRTDLVTLYFNYEDYQPQSLTQAECAMLHCLLDIFEAEK